MKDQHPVVLVTGCSSGLGYATALQLAQAGYRVYACVRKKEDLPRVQASFGAFENVFWKVLDLSSREDIARVSQEVLEEQGRIDVLINNAAATVLGPVDSTSPEEMERVFQVNVFGTTQLTQAFIPAMRAQRSGHIVFVTSMLGIESSAFLGAYAASKFAQEALATSLAATLDKWDIRVSVVQPGAVNTQLPHSIRAGSYYAFKEDPYAVFNKNALQFLKQCLEQGQSSEKVARLIQEILEDPLPRFRYQTCDFSEKLVQKHLKDPQLETWFIEHRKFINDWF